MEKTRNDKAFFYVFPTLKVEDDIQILFADVEVKKITTNSRRDFLHVHIFSRHLIQKKQIWQMERRIKDQLFSNVRVDVRIEEEYALSGQYTPEALMNEYRESIILELKDYSVAAVSGTEIVYYIIGMLISAVVGYIVARSKEVGLCKVRPIGAITKGEQGETLAEIGKMKDAGAVAISDDGKPVPNARIMRLAMEYASDFGMICLSHCEDKDLVDGGVVNEGYNSTLAGLKGIPRAAEEIMLAREIILAETLGKRVHICHVSTKGGVQLLREAKARGVQVTAETCPHYFTLTDDVVMSYDANTKVNPPIREAEDVEAIKEGLKDGTLDCIVTDHAPHHRDEKMVEYNLAAFGISGIETSFSLSYTYLVKSLQGGIPGYV